MAKPEVATLDKPKSDSIKVDVEKVQIAAPKAAEKNRYWIGVIDACPHDSVDVAGITFQKMTDPVRFRGDDQYRDINRGLVVALSDDDVEKVKKRVVVMWFQGVGSKNGKLLGGFKRRSDNVNFVPSEGDLPVAKFLFMKRLGPDETPSRSFGGPCPETMA